MLQDAREALRKTCCLARVSVGRSDGCHESNPSFHTITKVPSIPRINAVFMMGEDKSMKEAEDHNTILKTSQVNERIRFIRATNTASVINQYGKCAYAPQREIYVLYTTNYSRCERNQQAIQDGKHAKQFSCGQDVSNTMTTDRS